MDEALARQLTRQLKILNTWLIIMTTLFIVSMVIIGVLLFKLITFVNDTRDQISDVQEKAKNTLDIQQRICDGDSFLNKSVVCD